MSEIIREGMQYEKARLTPEQERLNRLSFPAYTYVLLGKVIEEAPSKSMKEALKADRLNMLGNLTLGQQAEVIQFAHWQTERIRRVHRSI